MRRGGYDGLSAEALGKILAAEREKCARIAESAPEDHVFCDHADGYMDGRMDAAAAIRALNKGN
jgi:hypothetical protein